MSHRFIPALIAVVATAIATPALAQQPNPIRPAVVSTTIHFTDAELHTVKGAKTAALRIRNAAAFVCGGDDIIYWRADNFIPCREDTIDRAVADLNAPLVSAALGRTSNLAQR